MTDPNQKTEKYSYSEADNKADAIAVFFIVLILVCTAVYFANQ